MNNNNNLKQFLESYVDLINTEKLDFEERERKPDGYWKVFKKIYFL